ncbi:hypothetical protein GGQ74_001511 [Desulfobaculum xiamenense]|uniref:Uncharacterized protein n=1 Tax=Desulfobaculum xiamenense TaxID=995050 RepID=A0A846QI59_9BACT|nr:hypothetical protein [Desulfobaculum xiamenense]NJB67871.1 hypothetical protein [Desulfobaculum xiamenense]
MDRHIRRVREVAHGRNWRVCRAGRRGFAISELLVGVLLLFAVLLGLLYIWTTDEGTQGRGLDVTPYRTANAVYAYNLLESYRVAVMNYIDMYGHLPGDEGAVNGTGRGDWRIERALGEDALAVAELHASGVVPTANPRVRGCALDLYWVSLVADGRELGGANYFVLRGFNADEARAMDWKFDDKRADAGNILYSPVDDEHVDLFLKIKLDG